MKFIKEIAKDWRAILEITFGCFIMAVAMNMFLVPHNIAPGGVSGLAIVIHALFRFPVGITMLVLNIPLFLLGIRQIGGMFGIKTLYGTILFSVFVDMTTWINLGTNDLLLASIFGGIIMGIGLGLIIRAGATTGGTDLAARIASDMIGHFSVGKVMFVIDLSIIIVAAITFKSYELGLYAVVSLFITARVIDTIIESSEATKGAIIISDRSKEISDRILKDMERGVTSLKGTGMYTGQERDVLLVVVDRYELVMLKKIVGEIDSGAFVILSDFHEVLGEGFKVHSKGS